MRGRWFVHKPSVVDDENERMKKKIIERRGNSLAHYIKKA